MVIATLAGVAVAILLLGLWFLTTERAAEGPARGALGTAPGGGRVGTLLIITSAALFLLLLVFWQFAVEHERVAPAFPLCGVGCLALGFVYGLGARGKIRVYVILSSLLLTPSWIAVAALLVKAAMD